MLLQSTSVSLLLILFLFSNNKERSKLTVIYSRAHTAQLGPSTEKVSSSLGRVVRRDAFCRRCFSE